MPQQPSLARNAARAERANGREPLRPARRASLPSLRAPVRERARPHASRSGPSNPSPAFLETAADEGQKARRIDTRLERALRLCVSLAPTRASLSFSATVGHPDIRHALQEERRSRGDLQRGEKWGQAPATERERERGEPTRTEPRLPSFSPTSRDGESDGIDDVGYKRGGPRRGQGGRDGQARVVVEAGRADARSSARARSSCIVARVGLELFHRRDRPVVGDEAHELRAREGPTSAWRPSGRAAGGRDAPSHAALAGRPRRPSQAARARAACASTRRRRARPARRRSCSCPVRREGPSQPRAGETRRTKREGEQAHLVTESALLADDVLGELGVRQAVEPLKVVAQEEGEAEDERLTSEVGRGCTLGGVGVGAVVEGLCDERTSVNDDFGRVSRANGRERTFLDGLAVAMSPPPPSRSCSSAWRT